MNRLILIGNGFDLAHGLKTSYNDFIKWYLTKGLAKVWDDGTYDDKLMSISRIDNTTNLRLNGIDSPARLVDVLYKNGLQMLLHPNIRVAIEGHSTVLMPFAVTFKSYLLKTLFSNCSEKNWVDIERHFYDTLLKFANPKDKKPEEIIKLNDHLGFIITELNDYLSTIKTTPTIPDLTPVFWSKVDRLELMKTSYVTDALESIMFLNFNYTDTAEKYFQDRKAKFNYIHGKINDKKNPIIFGFGDELDKNYQVFEDANDNNLLKYMKSFWYLKTDNYNDLVRFIQAGKFQVYVMGHSCGLSDRTMLHTIFENTNCVSIKIFYYEDKNGNSNFETITHEMSRHFKNKEVMREKIVKLPHCQKMPQFIEPVPVERLDEDFRSQKTSFEHLRK